MNVAMATPLSIIISALYSQMMGPDENSYEQTNSKQQLTIPIVLRSKEKCESNSSITDIEQLRVSNMVLRPKNANKTSPVQVERKLTIPIMKVIDELVKLSPVNIMLE